MDSDNDGLLDTLEGEKGCEPWNPDTDGDGIKDGDEYVTGTDPTKFTPLADRFRVKSLTQSGASGEVTFSFSSVEGRLYDVESTEDLAGSWTPTDFTNVPGTGGLLAYTNSPVHPMEFTRPRVRLAP